VSNALSKSLDKAIERSRQRTTYYGTVGKRLADGTWEFIPDGRPECVWVAMRLSSGGQTHVPAVNAAGVPHSPKLAVDMVKDGEDYVINRRSAKRVFSTPNPTPPSGVPTHTHGEHYKKTEHITTSSGVADAGKPIKTDAGGVFDASFYDPDDVVLTTGDQSVGGLKIFTALLTAEIALGTPLVRAISSAGLHLGDDAGNVALSILDGAKIVVLGSATHFEHFVGSDAQGNPTFFIRQPVSSAASTPLAKLVLSNNQTDGTLGNIAAIDIVNESIVDAEKRLAQILWRTDDETDRGQMAWRIFRDGVANDVFVMYSDGRMTIRRPDNDGPMLTFNDLTIVESGITFASGFQVFLGDPDDVGLTIIRDTASNALMGAGVGGDTFRRVTIAANGSINWGSGAADRDVNLYRPSADWLKTDDSFMAAVSIQTPLIVGSALAAGTITVKGTSHATPGSTLFPDPIITYGSGVGFVVVNFNGGAGSVRDFRWQSGGVDRMFMRLTSAAESGGNAGSNWNLQTRADDGSILDANAVVVLRSNSFFGLGIEIPLAKQHIVLSDAVTNAISNIQILNHTSSSTPAAGFGIGVLAQLKSSTTVNLDAGRLTWEWTTATHASRASKGKLSAFAIAAEVIGLTWDSLGNVEIPVGGLAVTGPSTVKPGTAVDTARVGGTLYVSTTQVGNVGTGEDDLASFSVPANTLAVNNQSIWFEAWGSFAANSNSKTLRVRFGTAGTNLVLDTGNVVSNASVHHWVIRGRIIRTGAATQKAYASGLINPTGLAGGSTPVDVVTGLDQTLSGAVSLRVQGEATSNNDILLETLIVGWDGENS
jgi:hypothetical protein